MRTLLSVCCVLWLGACAGGKGEQQKPAATSEVKAAPIPGPGLPEGGFITLDERGAYGPVRVAHLDVMTDGTARCFRQQLKKPDAQKTMVISDDDKMALQEAMLKSSTYLAGPQARQGTITDVGVTTLSVKDPSGTVVTHVIDGSRTVDPSQGEVMALLSSWLLRCAEQP